MLQLKKSNPSAWNTGSQCGRFRRNRIKDGQSGWFYRYPIITANSLYCVYTAEWEGNCEIDPKLHYHTQLPRRETEEPAENHHSRQLVQI